jgi:hypothetical protein
LVDLFQVSRTNYVEIGSFLRSGWFASAAYMFRSA